MAQAGIHALVGAPLRRWAPQNEHSAYRNWLVLGVLLGNLLPDADNLAVAVAIILKLPTEGLHRTFTHSLFTVVAFVVVFYLVGRVIHQPRWVNLGLGMGAGILMHILLDLLIWFNGVEILWPIPSWVNLWSGVAPPVWFDQLMMPVEFLFFALYFQSPATGARQIRGGSHVVQLLHEMDPSKPVARDAQQKHPADHRDRAQERRAHHHTGQLCSQWKRPVCH
jgi:membrane-bound metal-dependent hydrolase YbcI (DUF457 family)